MHIITALAVIVNIITIIVLLTGLLHTFKQPKNKAIYGYFVAISMLVCIFVLGLVAVYCLFVNNILSSLILILCVVSPFIIGKLVKYETLKKYTALQIVCFAASLVVLLVSF